MARGDQEAVMMLESSYLDEAVKNLDYAHAMAMSLFGRDIPYVLLMHVGALDAKLLPQLLALYRKHGVTFVSLQDAETDPFYRNDLDLGLDPSPDTLEEAMRKKGLPLPHKEPVRLDLASVCRASAAATRP